MNSMQLRTVRNILARAALVMAALFVLCAAPFALAEEQAKPANGTQVLEAFDRQQLERVNGASALSDHKKQVIMFLMGLPLVVLLLITGALGIAMGVFGKPLFVTHMVFAGLTMTLALVHVIVGLVWFYPF